MKPFFQKPQTFVTGLRLKKIKNQKWQRASSFSKTTKIIGNRWRRPSLGDCRFLREQVEAHRPDLVLLDIDMPHVDGLQGLFILKSHFPAVKALMLTIFDESEKVFQAICLGADGYLLKHTSPQKIIDAVGDAIDGGSPMTPSIARKVLSVFQKSGFQAAVVHDLTASELEVLRFLVGGLSYKMVAAERSVSINTIRSQIKSIYEKLRVHSVSEAVTKAIREQIV